MTVSPDALLTWAQRHPELTLLFSPNGTEADHDSAVERLIDKALRWLEDNANDLKGASENCLSTTLAGKISMPGLNAKRENNTNGHVDITIEIEHSYPQRRWLAEAKLWGGLAYHAEGMTQLIARYSTGRDRTGFVFDYVQAPDIDGKWTSLRAHLDQLLPLQQQGPAANHAVTWAFETHHTHASGRTLRVVHYGVNLNR